MVLSRLYQTACSDAISFSHQMDHKHNLLPPRETLHQSEKRSIEHTAVAGMLLIQQLPALAWEETDDFWANDPCRNAFRRHIPTRLIFFTVNLSTSRYRGEAGRGSAQPGCPNSAYLTLNLPAFLSSRNNSIVFRNAEVDEYQECDEIA
jgi:hypothetical protein